VGSLVVTQKHLTKKIFSNTKEEYNALPTVISLRRLSGLDRSKSQIVRGRPCRCKRKFNNLDLIEGFR
jgi:hypothetical protein